MGRATCSKQQRRPKCRDSFILAPTLLLDIKASVQHYGANLVFHLAAAVPLTRAVRTFRDINIGGTRNVPDAAVKHKISRVVHISTSAVYGIPRELPINENSPFNPLGQYGRAKLQAEVICREYRDRGFDVVIIRPRTIIGPSRLGIFQILFDWIRRGRAVPIIGSGDNLLQLVSSADLVKACMLSARKGGNEDFNIGTDQYSTVRTDLE